MISKTIKYTDFNGVEREEDFYFNLSKAELTEWQLSKDGGLDSLIEKIVKEKNVPKMIEYIKTFILKSYGIKSEDGKHFMKSEKISNEFYCSEAYSELFMEVSSSPEAAMNFINGILPSDIRQQIAEQQKAQTEQANVNAQN